MNEFERRIRRMVSPLSTRATQWWHQSARSLSRKRATGTASLRHEATSAAHRAASRMHDLRESERGQRAASALHDLRESGPAKRAGAALHDLRVSDAGKRAETTLADLRQREPVRKAEENARKVMHDLFAGKPGDSGTGSTGGGAGES